MEKNYDKIVGPVITEKSTMASEEEPGCVQGCQRCNQAGDQGRCRKLFSVKVKAVNTLVRKGKVKRFRGTSWPPV
jgi:large subunit ribosomal protein L23